MKTEDESADRLRRADPSHDTGNYVVITPARNEAQHLRGLLESMQSQSVLPSAWCIVDDGSTDATGSLAAEAAADTPWIHVVRRPDRGFRKAGGGVVDAVLDGLRSLDGLPWDYLVKLDADLRFDRTYFASCLREFDDDPTLGIAGGTIYNIVDGERVPEPHPRFHVRGATKIYRRACWEAIGGLAAAPGWDTVDEVTANRLGWTTRTLDIPLEQVRGTGTAAGQWSNWKKNGRAAYLAGYHPLFVLARSATRMAKPPYATAAVGLLWGYLATAARREPRLVDDDTTDFVHREQMNRLMGRKSMWR